MSGLFSSLFGINHLVDDGTRLNEVVLEEYDYIVVGGGTSGCTLASRLSENPSVKVLLLEAGVSGKSIMYTRIPSGFSKLFLTEHAFGFHTEPQQEAKGKRAFWPRGKMLGGCSSINAQMAQYGAPGDFDEWATIIGDDAWKWENFGKYFRKFEKYTEDPEYPQVKSHLKGSAGPMRVGYFGYISEGSKAFVEACQTVGIPRNHDFTTEGTIGVGLTYIDESRTRVSTETAYLTDDVLSRPNLKVVINATVTKITTASVDGNLRATGVEFHHKSGGLYSICSKRDIIVSAGAIHSPQLLMLSGIGPAEELEKHNIPVVQELPGVGDNLIDHPVIDIYYRSRFQDSLNFLTPKSFTDAFRLLHATYTYYISGRGPLCTSWGEAAAFCRTDDTKLFPAAQFPEKLTDSTSGPLSPDIELFTTPLAYKEHGASILPGHTFAIHVCLLRPLSRGKVTLKSADPFAAPAMDPRYLTAPEDIKRLIRGIRLILRIGQSEEMSARVDHSEKDDMFDQNLHLKTDEELVQVIRDRVETLYHPTSTCRMAPLADKGVVDSKLRVYGIQGLRVCDASIYPEIISGHTAGAAIAAAEYLADAIKAEIAV